MRAGEPGKFSLHLESEGDAPYTPRQVKIRGIRVDCVVVSRPENHWQTFGTQYYPAFASEIRVRATSLPPCR
jgi:acyl CoA:acetate/3-ketoacid CoA transferase